MSGPRPLVEQALARLEVIADSYLSVSTPVQVALPALLARRAELQAAIRARTRANLAAAAARAARHAGHAAAARGRLVRGAARPGDA